MIRQHLKEMILQLPVCRRNAPLPPVAHCLAAPAARPLRLLHDHGVASANMLLRVDADCSDPDLWRKCSAPAALARLVQQLVCP